jgi:hypothetical protein
MLLMPAYALMAGTVETMPWRCRVSSQSRSAERRSVAAIDAQVLSLPLQLQDFHLVLGENRRDKPLLMIAVLLVKPSVLFQKSVSTKKTGLSKARYYYLEELKRCKTVSTLSF